MIQEKPRYKHDCTRCHFLGQIEGHDLYFCPSDGGTIVSRFANHGPRYSSMPVEVIAEWERTGYKPANPTLLDGLKMARKDGLA